MDFFLIGSAQFFLYLDDQECRDRTTFLRFLRAGNRLTFEERNGIYRE